MQAVANSNSKKKSAKKTSGGKAPKAAAAGKPPGKKAALMAVAVSDLKDKAKLAKDPKVAASALDAIAEIQRNWNKWHEAKALQKKQGFECKEKIDADEAALKAAIEEELPATTGEESAKKIKAKLELVEMRWQEFEETKAGNVEVRKAAKDRVNNALEKLQRALVESAQLTLQFPASE